MRYGSVCSGIEAATQAWKTLGWEAAFFSEIEKFPSAVLAHHYGSNMPGEALSGNGVPNYGDMTKFKDWPNDTIDLLVGGTPCQSFSIAGLRKGLADPRGNLMLTYGAIAQRYKPKWLVWENVPGVLSSNEGRDFGTFLRLLGELGYGFAYRVLDAQYVRVDGFGRAVPQRRRRVFVVGYLGDWRRAAAVLFEPESMSGNSAPRRKAGKGAAGTIEASLGRSRGSGQSTAALIPDAAPNLGVAGTVDAGLGRRGQPEADKHHLVAARMTAIGEYTVDGTASTLKERDHKDATDLIAFNSKDHPTVRASNNVDGNQNAGAPPAIAFKPSHYTRGKDGAPSEVVPPLSADADKGDQDPVICVPEVAGTMVSWSQSGGFSNSADHAAAGYMIPVPPVAFVQNTRDEVRLMGGDGLIAGALSAEPGAKQQCYLAQPAVAFDMRGREGGAMPEGPHDTANIRAASGGSSRSYVAQPWAVRRLTPRECERLQGFPDDFTQIPWRGKLASECPDGPRYKACGNSMAVNAMRWIGRRIQMVEDLTDEFNHSPSKTGTQL